MLQPSRLICVTVALLAVTLLIPTSSSAQNQNQNRRARRQAQMANRAYAPMLASAQVGRQPANPADVQAVTQAYKLLAQADHDYSGHRAKAMKHLHQAGKVLGISLQGDGKAKFGEGQGTSDAQLKQAQTMLQQMTSNNAGGRRHQKAMQHVSSAMSEINTALSIK
jgi:hypothetical protein